VYVHTSVNLYSELEIRYVERVGPYTGQCYYVANLFSLKQRVSAKRPKTRLTVVIRNLFWSLKSATKYLNDRSNGLKVIAITKIQDGRQPTAVILDLLNNFKLQVLALVGPKWYTTFQNDRSNGLS
jgi:hypothetical protein